MGTCSTCSTCSNSAIQLPRCAGAGKDAAAAAIDHWERYIHACIHWRAPGKGLASPLRSLSTTLLQLVAVQHSYSCGWTCSTKPKPVLSTPATGNICCCLVQSIPRPDAWCVTMKAEPKQGRMSTARAEQCRNDPSYLTVHQNSLKAQPASQQLLTSQGLLQQIHITRSHLLCRLWLTCWPVPDAGDCQKQAPEQPEAMQRYCAPVGQ
jgi:hypothetical protein